LARCADQNGLERRASYGVVGERRCRQLENEILGKPCPIAPRRLVEPAGFGLMNTEMVVTPSSDEKSEEIKAVP